MDTLLLAEAGRLLDEAVDLRRRLHRRPELGLDNPRTQEAVLDALDDLPLEIRTGNATTSVVATLDGGREGPTVLLRGDMDALPLHEDTGLDFSSTVDGVMHACGHDTHVAMLAGAARLLSGRREDLAGHVRFMFQPGEEGHHGARVMLDEGLLDGDPPPSAAFAIHQTPTIRSGTIATKAGPILASGDALEIVVKGRGGHASMPHHALDPIPVLCEIVVALQTFVTRRIDVFDPAVVTVGRIRGGTANNVIPETASATGTIRTVSESTRTKVFDGVRRLVEGIASAHGAEADVTLRPGYPVTVNGEVGAEVALDVARKLVGDDRTIAYPTPAMGAEDFSYVLQQVEGALIFLGTRPEGVRGTEAAPNHSNRMVLDEEAMATGIALYSALALNHCSAS